MAHFQQLQFVNTAARHMSADWHGRAVLEIGSANVNGTIRPFFAGSQYTGVDLSPGPDVDLVASGDQVDLPSDSIDLAISCECFEHNPKWRETFLNMCRMTRPGGIVLVTCATRGRHEHGTTRTRPYESPNTISRGWDYYRNLTREDFERSLPIAQLFESHAFFRNDVSKDLYFVGRKTGTAPAPLRLDLPALSNEVGAANSVVLPDERRGLRPWLRALIQRPLKWAEHLPDPVFQDFVIRWNAAERAIRRVLRGK